MGFLKSSKGSSLIATICILIVMILVGIVFVDMLYFTLESYQFKQDTLNAIQKASEISIKEFQNNNFKSLIRESVDTAGNLNSFYVKRSIDNRELSIYMGKPFKYLFLWVIGFQGRQMNSKTVLILKNDDKFYILSHEISSQGKFQNPILLSSKVY